MAEPAEEAVAVTAEEVEAPRVRWEHLFAADLASWESIDQPEAKVALEEELERMEARGEPHSHRTAAHAWRSPSGRVPPSVPRRARPLHPVRAPSPLLRLARRPSCSGRRRCASS